MEQIFFLPLIELGESVADGAERSSKLLLLRLSAVSGVFIRTAGYVFLHRFLFQCRQNRPNDIRHQFVLTLLKAAQNSVEGEAVFYYFMGKDTPIKNREIFSPFVF